MSTDISKRERMTLLGAALGCKEPAPGFLGWLEEFAQKQEVSCGHGAGSGMPKTVLGNGASVPAQPAGINKFGAGRTPHVQASGTGSGCTERAMTPAPIHQPRTLQQIACTEAARELNERAARLCAHCHKELPAGQAALYWRGALLHQSCRVPFIVAQREMVKEEKGIHLVERTAR